MSPSGRTILLVDDQPEVLRSLRQLLAQDGHQVLAAASGGRALALLAGQDVDLCLVDYLMPVVQGELLLRAIRERDESVPIVLLTEHAGDAPSRPFLQCFGIFGCHDKLDGPERLRRWVELALDAAEARTRLRAADAVQGALTTALDGLRIAQALVAESSALDSAGAVASEHRRRIATELTMVLAKVDEWTRTAATLAGASTPAPVASMSQADLARRLTDELPGLLGQALGVAGDRLRVRVARALPPVAGDFDRLTQLLVRLLADDTARPDRTVAVEATAAAHETVLTITDQGRAGDPGLGAAVARCIVNVDFGGTLAWSVTDAGAVQFVLRLPEPGHERAPVPEPAERPLPRPAARRRPHAA